MVFEILSGGVWVDVRNSDAYYDPKTQQWSDIVKTLTPRPGDLFVDDLETNPLNPLVWYTVSRRRS